MLLPSLFCRRRDANNSSAGYASASSSLREYAVAALAVGAVTILSLAIEQATGYLAIALLYLLIVVALGARLGRSPVLLAAALSALLWNFLFIPPHFTFHIEKFQDAMMFAMFFLVALVMGDLTARVRSSELTERQRERRTAALYVLAHQAALAPELDAGLRAAVAHIESVCSAQVALLLRLPDHTLAQAPHGASTLALSTSDLRAAQLAFDQRRAAGRFTDVQSDAAALHLPLQARTAVMGVLSILPASAHVFEPSERELLDAFAVLIGLLLEKDHIAAAIKHAEILEASERLHRSLFDSVSHELKTPLAAVQAGLAALEQPTIGDNGKQIALIEVKRALRRLHRVIDNLLDMTRIEAETLKPKLEWSDVDEVIQNAVELGGDALSGHPLDIHIKAGMPMVKIDHALIEQALRNLLVNAAQWSPPESTIAVRAELTTQNELTMTVSDQGPGIAPQELAHVFKKFYRGGSAATGGTGLGLSIVEGFVRAHGGTVSAGNRAGGGAQLQIRLPVETLDQAALETRV